MEGGLGGWYKVLNICKLGEIPKWSKYEQGVKGGGKLWSFYDNVIIECPESWV